MSIKRIITAILLGIGLIVTTASPTEARRRHKHRKVVVVKRKVVHHRHRVGVRHIGRGTRVKTETRVERH